MRILCKRACLKCCTESFREGTVLLLKAIESHQAVCYTVKKFPLGRDRFCVGCVGLVFFFLWVCACFLVLLKKVMLFILAVVIRNILSKK